MSTIIRFDYFLNNHFYVVIQSAVASCGQKQSQRCAKNKESNLKEIVVECHRYKSKHCRKPFIFTRTY